ncbi:MAG: hypothetical protein TR69_WS6001001513 [candidate division WS6 bacterium OLB20]|uniref:Uncharacterized protein n=1 Tax=candidate division WS6 bacterium OLB20 TaxID=1617426 RepID=A0A136LVM6_9BACT|nr:MAG: hypothetical protein TR69_WS6001001513 [candidate division WS6 bacterium OLB20]
MDDPYEDDDSFSPSYFDDEDTSDDEDALDSLADEFHDMDDENADEGGSFADED